MTIAGDSTRKKSAKLTMKPSEKYIPRKEFNTNIDDDAIDEVRISDDLRLH